MAVDGVPTLLAERESGFHDAESIRGYEEVWRVNVTSATDSVSVAGSAPGLPRLFLTPYRGDAGAYPVEVRPERVKNTRLAWDVHITYSNHLDREPEEDNPLAQPAKISWKTVKTTRYLMKDLDGKAFLNTSGERMGLVSVKRSLLSLVITRNEPQFNPFLRSLVNRVNSVDYSGGPPETVFLDDVSAEPRRQGQITYWPTTYQFLFDDTGWQPELLNEGLTEMLILGETAPMRMDIMRNNVAITVPVPLHISTQSETRGTDIDGNTRIALAGSSLELELKPGGGGPRYPYGIDDVEFIKFKGYEEVDFNILGLPV